MSDLRTREMPAAEPVRTVPTEPTERTEVWRLGTRGSALARAQALVVARALEAGGDARVELVEVSTEGDRNRAPLTDIGGQGVFTSAVREALVRGDVDIVVHSLKDLPTTDDPRVRLAAVPAREDPRDALVSRGGHSLASLPSGSVVGTGSPRRAAQLHALDRALRVVPVRGNVDTRLRLVAEGDLDAVVVALAGLVRLGRADEAVPIEPHEMVPAPGQGALAVELAAGAPVDLCERVAALGHDATRWAVIAERSVLRRLEAGCSAPVGALARVVATPDGAGVLQLMAVVAAPDGHRLIRREASGPCTDAAGIGGRLADELLATGAGELMPSALVGEVST